MNSTLVPPSTQPNSPGSSIFDLPTQPSGALSRPSELDVRSPLQPLGRTPSGMVTSPRAARESSYLVVSGGTGCNSIVSAFGAGCCYVLPVSDDGGSSSEIIRVLGGPSIGDIRSRLIRLIPRAPPGSPEEAIRTLLAHRFPTSCTPHEAREAWTAIVQGRSALWGGIPEDRKETIRGFLVYFESELLRRAHKNFSFVNGSVGNYFLAAAAMFFRSLPSAIFLFSSITKSQANILPVIVTNHTVTLAAELANQEHIFGQCEISHPVRRPPTIHIDGAAPADVAEDDDDDEDNDNDGPLAQHAGNVTFEQHSKGTYTPLTTQISRVYYINAYGQEIHPAANADFLRALDARDVLVYSCGSLWTSVMPCLSLRGVARAIAGSRSLRAKVLLLNAANDRETDGYAATDYLAAITRTLNHPHERARRGPAPQAVRPQTEYPCSAFVTHLIYLEGSAVAVDVAAIARMGVRCVAVRPAANAGAPPQFDAECVRGALRQILEAEDA